jgi:hypothetical protein
LPHVNRSCSCRRTRGSQEHSVGHRQPRPVHLTAQHRQLMPKHDNLELLEVVRARTQAREQSRRPTRPGAAAPPQPRPRTRPPPRRRGDAANARRRLPGRPHHSGPLVQTPPGRKPAPRGKTAPTNTHNQPTPPQTDQQATNQHTQLRLPCRSPRILRHPTGVGWSAIHPASTCAVPDLIADVSALTSARTCAHTARARCSPGLKP